ncbi:hypothetical protein JTB14_026681 [Gonioctena quinquepunctata]|nr:hypothetical protein JTB14_026681 [Gonioctena quinquepunctata]
MNCNETVESDEYLNKQEADEKKEVELKNYLKLEENDEPKIFEESMKMRNRRKWMKMILEGGGAISSDCKTELEPGIYEQKHYLKQKHQRTPLHPEPEWD